VSATSFSASAIRILTPNYLWVGFVDGVLHGRSPLFAHVLTSQLPIVWKLSLRGLDNDCDWKENALQYAGPSLELIGINLSAGRVCRLSVPGRLIPQVDSAGVLFDGPRWAVACAANTLHKQDLATPLQ